MSEVIEWLCRDRAFGILTRNGLEYRLREVAPAAGRDLVLMDFCNVSKLNTRFGYAMVNCMFTDLFQLAHLSRGALIGRCFSGDEIVLVTDLAEDDVGELRRCATGEGISFRWGKTTYTGNVDADLSKLYDKIS